MRLTSKAVGIKHDTYYTILCVVNMLLGIHAFYFIILLFLDRICFCNIILSDLTTTFRSSRIS
jgi:hypothetical protein